MGLATASSGCVPPLPGRGPQSAGPAPGPEPAGPRWTAESPVGLWPVPKVRTTLMLGLVFIETAIIYALLVVILIIFVL